MTTEKPVLYSYFRSSCSWRVRSCLALKNVEYEYRSVNILQGQQLDAEYLKTNPMGQVPALVINGTTMTQSISMMEYLEETYPKVALLPKCPLQRAKVREICEIIASGIQPIQNLSVLKRVGDEKKMQWGHDAIYEGFVALEKVLKTCSKTYCLGDSVTLADCCLVPQVYNAGRFNVDMSHFPNIERVDNNLAELEAFKKAHPSKQPDCPEALR